MNKKSDQPKHKAAPKVAVHFLVNVTHYGSRTLNHNSPELAEVPHCTMHHIHNHKKDPLCVSVTSSTEMPYMPT